jgi:hypothetical protein
MTEQELMIAIYEDIICLFHSDNIYRELGENFGILYFGNLDPREIIFNALRKNLRNI